MPLVRQLSTFTALILIAASSVSASANSESDNEAKTSIDFNLRYEAVAQDNALKDAGALTLRTRLNYTSANYHGFTGVVEFEDSRQVAGIKNYNDTLGNNTPYAVVADPETTELDQAFVQYQQDKIIAKVGRQVITLDNHRYLGHVGWRQDRQTFDAVTLDYTPVDHLKISYSYINKRNRIFAQIKDLHSKDHLLNIAYKTDYGLLTAYSYLLDVDEGATKGIDTFGLRLNANKNKFTYFAEYARQSADTSSANYSTSYMAIEGGYSFDAVAVKLGAEVLGSDEAMYGFSTPLATLHKFNGWADQFLLTPKEGLVDIYASIAGKVFNGSWTLAVHDYSADKATDTVDDLGREVNVVYTKKFAKNYTAGIKYATYSAGDSSIGKVDTDKFWLWLSANF